MNDRSIDGQNFLRTAISTTRIHKGRFSARQWRLTSKKIIGPRLIAVATNHTSHLIIIDSEFSDDLHKKSILIRHQK